MTAVDLSVAREIADEAAAKDHGRLADLFAASFGLAAETESFPDEEKD